MEERKRERGKEERERQRGGEREEERNERNVAPCACLWPWMCVRGRGENEEN